MDEAVADEPSLSYLAQCAARHGSPEAEIASLTLTQLREWSHIVHHQVNCPPDERIFGHAQLVTDWRRQASRPGDTVSITKDFQSLCQAVDISVEDMTQLSRAEFLKLLVVVGVPCPILKAHLTLAFSELQQQAANAAAEEHDGMISKNPVPVPSSGGLISRRNKSEQPKPSPNSNIGKQEVSSAAVHVPAGKLLSPTSPSTRKRAFDETIPNNNAKDDNNPAAYNSTTVATTMKKVKWEEDQYGEDNNDNVLAVTVPDAQGTSSSLEDFGGEEDKEERGKEEEGTDSKVCNDDKHIPAHDNSSNKILSDDNSSAPAAPAAPPAASPAFGINNSFASPTADQILGATAPALACHMNNKIASSTVSASSTSSTNELVASGISINGIKAGSEPEEILKFLVEMRALNLTTPTRTYAVPFFGYSSKSASWLFANDLIKLHALGLLEYPTAGKPLELTSKGFSECIRRQLWQASPKTNAEMHQRVLNILRRHKYWSHKCQAIFELLKDGKTRGIKELAESMGYYHTAGSRISNIVKRMSIIGILDRPNKEEAFLSDTCYPFGRPRPTGVAATNREPSASRKLVSNEDNVIAATVFAAAATIGRNIKVKSKGSSSSTSSTNELVATGSSSVNSIKADSEPEKIFKALAWFRVLSLRPTRLCVANYLGHLYPSDNAFADAVRWLQTKGLVEYTADREPLALSSMGIAECNRRQLSQAVAPKTDICYPFGRLAEVETSRECGLHEYRSKQGVCQHNHSSFRSKHGHHAEHQHDEQHRCDSVSSYHHQQQQRRTPVLFSGYPFGGSRPTVVKSTTAIREQQAHYEYYNCQGGVGRGDGHRQPGQHWAPSSSSSQEQEELVI